jgi:hypothetical protein
MQPGVTVGSNEAVVKRRVDGRVVMGVVGGESTGAGRGVAKEIAKVAKENFLKVMVGIAEGPPRLAAARNDSPIDQMEGWPVGGLAEPLFQPYRLVSFLIAVFDDDRRIEGNPEFLPPAFGDRAGAGDDHGALGDT